MDEEDEAAYLYVSLKKEDGYGVILTSRYEIMYFEYNVDPSLDIGTRAGPENMKAVETFSEHSPFRIVSYDFNYSDGSFMYLD